MPKHWTEKQEMYLTIGSSAYGIEWLRTKSAVLNGKKSYKRSINAIRCKAYRMRLKGLNTGAKSLKELIETTGYSKSQLFRAQRAMNQKWLRSSKKGNYLITIDQIEELLDWLKEDYWCKSKRLYNCVYCGSHNKKHVSFGLCRNCLKVFKNICNRLNFIINQELIMKLKLSTDKNIRALGRRLNKKIAISEEQIISVIGYNNVCVSM